MDKNLADIAALRLSSQQLDRPKFKTAKEVVAWMGAMQAQDDAMLKWAVGLRLPNSSLRDVEAAIDAGEIIRTHVLRPTWHLVSADDVYWMLDLTAPHIKASMKSRLRELELSDAILTKTNTIIAQALSGGNHLTRKQLVDELEKNKIITNENRASHIFIRAELDGIICSGVEIGGNQTYALLEERVAKSKSLSRDEALASLARKYFVSHGPAAIEDFAWWSGLSKGDAKLALAIVKADFFSETIAGRIYWSSNLLSPLRLGRQGVHLLPAFDEFIIAYTDRSAALRMENHKKAVSDNGIFRPVILENGQVIGIWKRTIKKDKVSVEAQFFIQPDQTTMNLIERAVMQFGQFLEKGTEFLHAF